MGVTLGAAAPLFLAPALLLVACTSEPVPASAPSGSPEECGQSQYETELAKAEAIQDPEERARAVCIVQRTDASQNCSKREETSEEGPGDAPVE